MLTKTVSTGLLGVCQHRVNSLRPYGVVVYKYESPVWEMDEMSKLHTQEFPGPGSADAGLEESCLLSKKIGY